MKFRNLKRNHRIKEDILIKELIQYLNSEKILLEEVEQEAYILADNFRKKSKNKLRVENLMNAYPLNSDRGRHLMSLSEALIRIPDNNNQENLIVEKVKHNWLISLKNDVSLIVFSFLLQIGSMFLPKKKGFLSAPITKFARIFSKKIVTVIAKQFVIAEKIEDALKKSVPRIAKGQSFSYDMLGEAARTDTDAKFYFNQYRESIIQTGEFSRDLEDKSSVSISIKLSSLHSRYETSQFDKIKSILYVRLYELCLLAKEYGVILFIDAEEAERLELSLDMFEDLMQEKELKEWKGLGIVVQAYQKRGFATIDYVIQLARRNRRKIYLRLVKGAYWDAEIKLDQVNGVEDFSLFTRKEHTDISYLACAKKLSTATDLIYPCFATHNAFSIAYVRKVMQGKNYEFQSLEGMGEELYSKLGNNSKLRIYAPVGQFNHLLPYLVRRLLENGAKSSFINQILDYSNKIEEVVQNPIVKSNQNSNSANNEIKLPRDIFSEEQRLNSKGIDMTDKEVLQKIEKYIADNKIQSNVNSIVSGKDVVSSNKQDIINPANTKEKLGVVTLSDVNILKNAIDVADSYFPTWNKTKVERRADILVRASNELENRTQEFINILVKEAGKTIKDSVLEIREAVDFLRYYAGRAKQEFNEEGIKLPSVVGEEDKLYLEGRGVFLCISPWNFPLAIFVGQIAASLVAGNTVLAKPAESTTIVGYEMVKLLHKAGIPAEALQYIPVEGSVAGDTLLTNPKLKGVAFTGSDITAKLINRKLAERETDIIPLIAETGGQNAMIVDSSALKEQVVRDVIASAFQSAGQRCSALRVLFLQQEIADELITMISDAMDDLSIENPEKAVSDVGPVINQKALDGLLAHKLKMQTKAKLIKEYEISDTSLKNGYFFAPLFYEIKSIRELEKEEFGPILHVVRYKLDEMEKLVQEIHSSGFGLTFAIHSRLERNIKYFSENLRVGNIYVNRNQIGAIVSSQPFGGMGNSGTGPKAGGPFYLHKFATEKTVSTDLTAWGGNIDLMTRIK